MAYYNEVAEPQDLEFAETMRIAVFITASGITDDLTLLKIDEAEDSKVNNEQTVFDILMYGY